MRYFKNHYFLACMTGILLVLGFSPFKIWPLGFIVPAVLFLITEHKKPKAAFWLGFSFGIGEFGVGASWVYVSLSHYGNSAFLAFLITLLFILILALFPAVQLWVMQRFFKTGRLLKLLLIYPLLWLVFEGIRSTIFTGFPWLLVGYTQTFNWLAGFAKLGSVFLVSFLCVFIAGLLVLLWKKKGEPSRPLLKGGIVGLILILFIAGGILRHHPFTKPVGSPLQVALVQGNITNSLKWTPDYFNQIVMTYARLTGPVLNTPLIVWPENSIPNFPENITPFMNALDNDTGLFKSALVFGLPIDDPINHAYFNGALALGDANGMYLKQHLVPFGEYIPWPGLFSPIFNHLNIPMSAFTAGPDDPLPMIIHGIPVQIFICYESAYPFLFREAQNSAYIITLTDDGWFGHSLGPYQHEEIEAMRAIETGRPILRATNSGITSIIDQNGRIIASAPTFKEFVLKGVIQPVNGKTPWLRM